MVGRKDIIRHFCLLGTIVVLMETNVDPRKKAPRAQKGVAPPQTRTLMVCV